MNRPMKKLILVDAPARSLSNNPISPVDQIENFFSKIPFTVFFHFRVGYQSKVVLYRC